VRAARRALAVNPDDAQAYEVLGESYLRLIRDTRERAWRSRLPQLVQIRHVQASAALNQAVLLNPPALPRRA
jgi:Flp pilus assembly protein TadD